jgi:hypothetical protein
MGFGYRVYKTYDPRAKMMRKALHEVLETVGRHHRDDPVFKVGLELEPSAGAPFCCPQGHAGVQVCGVVAILSEEFNSGGCDGREDAIRLAVSDWPAGPPACVFGGTFF